MSPDEALDLLRPALADERPLMRIEDVSAALDERRGVLWMGARSAIFTQVDDYRSGERVISAGPAGGDLAEIIGAIPRLEAWGREAGCTVAEVVAGRLGWRRMLAPLGYSLSAVTLRKVLVNA